MYGEKVDNKVRGHCSRQKSRKSVTQIIKASVVICVADCHDLCHKVSIMEFGL